MIQLYVGPESSRAKLKSVERGFTGGMNAMKVQTKTANTCLKLLQYNWLMQYYSKKAT